MTDGRVRGSCGALPPCDPNAGESPPATRGAAGVRTLERALQPVIPAQKSPVAAAKLHVPPAGGGRARAVPRGGHSGPSSTRKCISGCFDSFPECLARVELEEGLWWFQRWSGFLLSFFVYIHLTCLPETEREFSYWPASIPGDCKGLRTVGSKVRPGSVSLWVLFSRTPRVSS